jgi:hypothetical protein
MCSNEYDAFGLDLCAYRFGLFGDMLGSESHGSASVGSHEPNLFRGMVFGMTTRYACTDVSTPIWQLWDSFGIEKAVRKTVLHFPFDDIHECDCGLMSNGLDVMILSVIYFQEMIGWWDDDAPVESGHADVQVTSYLRHGNATLLAVGSWATCNLTVTLQIDWAALGLSGSTATVEAPAMAGVQPHATFPVAAGGVTLPVEAAAGWLLILSGNTDTEV